MYTMIGEMLGALYLSCEMFKIMEMFMFDLHRL